MKNGYYRHFKGKYYQVIDLALHSETEEKYVIYRALYGERQLFVRPLAMFAEIVHRDGHSFPRFVYIGEVLPEEALAETEGQPGK